MCVCHSLPGHLGRALLADQPPHIGPHGRGDGFLDVAVLQARRLRQETEALSKGATDARQICLHRWTQREGLPGVVAQDDDAAHVR